MKNVAPLYHQTEYNLKEKLKYRHNLLIFSVPEEGLEPSRPEGHMALNHACLPIPALGRLGLQT